MLEQLQMRASKLILVFRDLSNEEILKEYRLTTLQTRRLRGIKYLEEVFMILNGHEYIDPNIFFFKIKTGKITRGHELTLVKGQSRLDVRKYSFPQRTVKKCNKLLAD